MAELIILQEPIPCPICKEQMRQGFLEEKDGEMESLQMRQGRRVVFECSTCHALYGVQE